MVKYQVPLHDSNIMKFIDVDRYGPLLLRTIVEVVKGETHTILLEDVRCDESMHQDAPIIYGHAGRYMSME